MEEKELVDMPPEWSDDQKMSVLFSPFRQSRQVNPDGWDGKLHFWTRCITKRCLETGTAVIVPSELPRMFQRRGRLPFCLGTVVETMIRNGQLCELSDVLLCAEQSWSWWTYDLFVRRPTVAMFNVFVKKPVMWTFSKLFSNEKCSTAMSTYTGTVTSSGGLSDKQFVVIDVVKHLGEQIQKTFYGNMTNQNKDRLVSMTTLRQMTKQCCPCDISFKLALSWLCREKKCLVIDVEGQGKVVVFADLSKKRCEPPTDTEVTVYKLNCTTDELQKQIETLQHEMDSLHTEAKLYLKKGMKGSAKNCLRRKKRLELQQRKKEAAIENIHQLLCTIQQTETDKQVLDVYSSSVAAYKDLTKKHGLTTEAVDDVMLGIQEVLDTQEEMDHSISTSVLPGDLTSDDLEQELKDILADENISAKFPQSEPHQDLINALCQMRVVEGQLPDVPTGIPAAPDNLPAVPDNLPAVPHDLPSIPDDLPAVPDSLPAVPSKTPHDQRSYISEPAFST